MAEKHPHELELLSFVEEELDDRARVEVAEHLVACRSCADQVRRLEAGRAALRDAPLLELPAGRREEIVASLPERRDPWRLFRPVKKALVVAAPVAGAAVLVGVFVMAGTQLRGGGDDDDAAAPAAEEAADAGAADTAETQQAQEGGAEESEAAPALDAALVRSVQGPAAEIVRILEAEGIPAEVDLAGAVVAEARAGEVRAALAGRPSGDVPVYVR
jgi:anti-sigma factor RsiW